MTQDAAMKQKHLTLTIKATNGDPWETDRFKTNDTVAEVIDKAVKHFVKKGSMAEGEYDLSLVVDGQAQQPLSPADKLEDTDVRDASTLVLTAKPPQVDG